MPKVTYTRVDGSQETLDVPAGTSVMQAAVSNGIDEIVAECGGNLMCATCHVYVERAHPDVLPEMQADEDAMLECVEAERQDNSRLSCQLVLPDDAEEVLVRLPESQL
jgi:ferredoxin, 2Fe-2S